MEQIGLEQAYDLTVLGHIDRFCSRDLWQTRHRHDVAGQNDHKSRTCGNADILDGDGKSVRCAELGRIIGEGVLRLCHTDRQITEAVGNKRVDLLLCGGKNGDAVTAVNLLDDRFDLFGDGEGRIVAECEVVFFLG